MYVLETYAVVIVGGKSDARIGLGNRVSAHNLHSAFYSEI
jgi:hypothetical protein